MPGILAPGDLQACVPDQRPRRISAFGHPGRLAPGGETKILHSSETETLLGPKIRSPTGTKSEITFLFSNPVETQINQSKHQITLKSRRSKEKNVTVIHIGAPATHTTTYRPNAPTTPESMADTTGDSPNVQPLPPGAPGFRVILVKINICVERKI